MMREVEKSQMDLSQYEQFGEHFVIVDRIMTSKLTGTTNHAEYKIQL